MSLLRQISAGLRGLFRKKAVERELDDELQHYLEMATLHYMREGMSRAEGERRARMQLRGVEAVKEEVRSAFWETRVETLWQDVRYGARTLRRNPAFSAVAMLTLALGIGANTAMFSVIQAVLLRPLPYHEPDRLAILWTTDPGQGLYEEGTSYPNFTDWRNQSRLFADMAVWAPNPVTLTGGAEPERLVGQFASANLFPLLGVAPMIGRVFSAEEAERGERVVVLSHGLWQRRFGGDPGVVGRTIEIAGDASAWKLGPRRSRIIGVMPAGFYFPSKEVQLWEPVGLFWRWDRVRADRGSGYWRVVGRLAPEGTVPRAQAEVTAIGQRLALTYPEPMPSLTGTRTGRFDVRIVPILDQVTGKSLQRALWVLLGAVGFVLLIACANVANLTLARGAARQHELALRMALGAGRWRLPRQLLIESGMLAGVGGLAGLGLAAAAIRVLAAFAPPGITRLEEVRIDFTVLLFTGSVALVAAIIFGLAPAWKISRSATRDLLGEAPRSGSGGLRLRHAHGLLVVAECALAVTLLTGAGLLIRSFLRLQAVDPGFSPDGVVVARITLAARSEIPGADLRVHRTLEETLERVAALPGVRSVGAITELGSSGDPNQPVAVAGRPPLPPGEAPVLTRLAGTTPGFFETMGAPFVRGRAFASWEEMRRRGDEPGLINEALARRLFLGKDPIGERIRIGEPGSGASWLRIVGVVGDMRRDGLERPAVPEVFTPGVGGSTFDVVARTDADPRRLGALFRQAIRSVDPHTIILEVSTIERRLGDLSAARRFQMLLLALFAAVALSLSAVGIYGVLHYSVAQRTRELGIRIALGAGARDVLRLVVRQGMTLVLVGVAAGLLAAVGLTRLLTHMLFGVRATDPATFVGVALLLAGGALLACSLPAARAARVDPLVALRHD